MKLRIEKTGIFLGHLPNRCF